MISIIVSSKSRINLIQFENSVSSTISTAYELIIIDNPGTMGICEAYNKGAASAKFPYLCFVHDDVKFITPNWGQALQLHFQSDINIGAVGIAGSVCKSKMPASWWQPNINGIALNRMNVFQRSKNTDIRVHDLVNSYNEERSVVATLDGVFLAVKKEVWEKNSFDEKLLKGFHGYDIDFTLNIGRTHNNYVVYDILLEHFSEGKTDMNWLRAVIAVHKKWKHILPVVKDKAVNDAALKKVDRYWFDYLLSVNGTTKKERKEKLFLCLKLLPLLGLRNITMNDLKRFKILAQQGK